MIRTFSDKEFKELKQVLQLKGSIEANIQGSSMYPLLKDGDIVKVEPIKVELVHLKRFQIVIFKNEKDVLVCHYVKINFIKEKNVLICQGINKTSGEDLPVYPDSILGVVHKPKIQGLMKFKIFMKILFLELKS